MTIVLGYDESPGADQALQQAVDLARLRGDRLLIVYGAEPPSVLGEEQEEHLEAIEEQGRATLTTALDKARSAGVVAEMELLDDRPAQALVAAARAHDAWLIVVGTYAESPIKGAILGSTPHRLLQISDRPVLCVPPLPAP